MLNNFRKCYLLLRSKFIKYKHEREIDDEKKFRYVLGLKCLLVVQLQKQYYMLR